MVFDLRTVDAAYKSLLEFVGMTSEEFILDFAINCQSNVDTFWARHFGYIDCIDINKFQFRAFHVTGVLDDCGEIKSSGLKDLQKMLSEDTSLSRTLRQYGLTFNLPERTMLYQGKQICIDYDRLRGHSSNDYEECVESVAHRIYYDYCINGFFCCDDISGYGTNIDKRPEFILKLVHLFPELKIIESEWMNGSRGYKVAFYVWLDQIAQFTFPIDEPDYVPCNDFQELNEVQKIKKWMLFTAIERGFQNDSAERYMYIKDGIQIPPEQIIACERIA